MLWESKLGQRAGLAATGPQETRAQGKNLPVDLLPFRKPVSCHGESWEQQRGDCSFLLGSHEDSVDGRWSHSPLCLVRSCIRHWPAATFARGLFQRVRRTGTQLVPATQGSAARPRGTGRVTHYLLYLLFAWASDGAEQNGAQIQALPHGPDQISRSLSATGRGGLRNTLPVCWGLQPLVQQGPSWRQEARMTEMSSR